MQVTVHMAKTQLSKLIEAALDGEEVVIARGRRPLVKIVPIANNGFTIGLLNKELAGTAPDFFGPMDSDELALWNGAK